jgi:hypothetical protein
MRTLRAWFVRLGAVLQPGRRDRELADELNGHLEHAIEENLRSGMAPAGARGIGRIRLDVGALS